MVGWYFGESNVMPRVIKESRSGEAPIFDLVWLLMWTLFGLYFSSGVIWRLLGSEFLAVANERLTRRKQIPGFGGSLEFDTRQITALSFRPEQGAGKGYGGSRIEFAYGAKTYNFGAGVQPAEAFATSRFS